MQQFRRIYSFQAARVLTLIAALSQSSLTAQTQTNVAVTNAPAPAPNNALLNALIRKGILSEDEAKQIQAETDAAQMNGYNAAMSKWRFPDAIKDIGLYGDFRFRYEYRGVDNAPGVQPDTFYRERFRYAVRLGIRGDMTDDITYGLRLETSTNPRSPWVTFADDSQPTPSDKHSDGVSIGQVFVGWHPNEHFEMTVGRMGMPLYTTPMVWDSDINPEGAFEKVNWDAGNVNLFADFGQFDYQDPSSAAMIPSSDVFILAWQAGATVNLDKDMFVKAAPVLYTYTGVGATNGLDRGLTLPYTGQGSAGLNVNYQGGTAFNQNGINSLMVLEIPVEFDFPVHIGPLGNLEGRFFGDFAINMKGKERAEEAAIAGGLSQPYKNDIKAYQAGFGIGSLGTTYGPMQGLVYGTSVKKRTWEARVYYQHVEQYALDVNLMDSDFFEGRANLEGYYSAFAYSFTDSVIGTLRFGYASRINSALGMGGNNLDIPGLNPINNYHVAQMDLTVRF